MELRGARVLITATSDHGSDRDKSLNALTYQL